MRRVRSMGEGRGGRGKEWFTVIVCVGSLTSHEEQLYACQSLHTVNTKSHTSSYMLKFTYQWPAESCEHTSARLVM